MNTTIDILTLGVADLDRATRFYRDGLGFPVTLEAEDYIRFETGETALALYPRGLLAADATVSADGSGFSGITIAQIVGSKAAIEETLAVAEAAGGTIVKPAQTAAAFSGFSGYFADPDGYLWEIASFTE